MLVENYSFRFRGVIMKRNSRLWIARHKLGKGAPILCLLICCLPLMAFFGCGAIRTIKSTAETVGFMKDMTAQLKEREASLMEAARKPLTEDQEKLLIRLLQQEKDLDAVLSSQPYLTYLEAQVGAAHKDYPTYLAAVPTTEQKSVTTFALKEILPPEATDEQIQICTDFYFQFRELIVNEPHITADSEEMKPFIEEHLVRPLMDTWPSEPSTSEITTVIQMSVVPAPMALTDRDAYRQIWLEQLEVYSSREGLLRCAILTPDEFAFTRSFFHNIDAFERWIKRSPEQK